MQPYVLTADIGTTSLKCACVDFDGKLLSFSRVPLKAAPGKTVLAGDWENAFKSAVKDLSGSRGSLKPEAICISGNGPTLVPVTFEDESLHPLHWHDERALAPDARCDSFFLPRAAWLRRNGPCAYESVKYFLPCHDWLMNRLGAQPTASLPGDAYIPYYWDEKQCGVFDLDKTRFPPFAKMGTMIGKLSHKASLRFGLDAGIPLVSGAPDFISALIGTGVISPGDVCDRAGSSEGINLCVTAPVDAEGLQIDLRILPHAKEELWNLGAVIPQSGKLIETFVESCGKTEKDYGEILEALIQENYQTEDRPGELPSAAPGSIERGRSMLREMGFSVRLILEKFNDLGFPVGKMTVSGGQGKNPLWNQLKADITGTVLQIPEIIDAELAGNAVLAAMALGEVSSLESGAGKMIRIHDKYFPDEEKAPFWKEQFLRTKG